MKNFIKKAVLLGLACITPNIFAASKLEIGEGFANCRFLDSKLVPYFYTQSGNIKDLVDSSIAGRDYKVLSFTMEKISLVGNGPADVFRFRSHENGRCFRLSKEIYSPARLFELAECNPNDPEQQWMVSQVTENTISALVDKFENNPFSTIDKPVILNIRDAKPEIWTRSQNSNYPMTAVGNGITYYSLFDGYPQESSVSGVVGANTIYPPHLECGLLVRNSNRAPLVAGSTNHEPYLWQGSDMHHVVVGKHVLQAFSQPLYEFKYSTQNTLGQAQATKTVQTANSLYGADDSKRAAYYLGAGNAAILGAAAEPRALTPDAAGRATVQMIEELNAFMARMVSDPNEIPAIQAHFNNSRYLPYAQAALRTVAPIDQVTAGMPYVTEELRRRLLGVNGGGSLQLAFQARLFGKWTSGFLGGLNGRLTIPIVGGILSNTGNGGYRVTDGSLAKKFAVTVEFDTKALSDAGLWGVGRVINRYLQANAGFEVHLMFSCPEKLFVDCKISQIAGNIVVDASVKKLEAAANLVPHVMNFARSVGHGAVRTFRALRNDPVMGERTPATTTEPSGWSFMSVITNSNEAEAESGCSSQYHTCASSLPSTTTFATATSNSVTTAELSDIEAHLSSAITAVENDPAVPVTNNAWRSQWRIISSSIAEVNFSTVWVNRDSIDKTNSGKIFVFEKPWPSYFDFGGQIFLNLGTEWIAQQNRGDSQDPQDLIKRFGLVHGRIVGSGGAKGWFATSKRVADWVKATNANLDVPGNGGN